MQPGLARTSDLRVPPLLLPEWLGWVAPVRPTHEVWVFSRPSAALRVHVCAVSWATWHRFTDVPAWCVVLRVRCPGPLGSCSAVCSLAALHCLCVFLGHLAPVQQFSRSVCCVAHALSWATWLPFTGVPARCVTLRVRCPGPLGSFSPVCPLCVLCCVCGVLGHLAAVHRCDCSSNLLHVQCPGPPGSCSQVCLLRVLCCMCGVLGHLAPLHRFARSVRCFACAVSWAMWLPSTGVPARWPVLRVWCPRPLGSCTPVCLFGVLCCVYGPLSHLAPVHRCASAVCCVACVVSEATWLLFNGVPARCVALFVWCPGPLGSLPPRSVCCVAHAVSRATWLLFTSVPARCVVLRVRCPGPVCCCSAVCPFGVLCCVCGVLGHLAPVQPCARSVCCVACAVSWATWLRFISVPAPRVVLCVRYPGPLGSCSPLCLLGVLCCVCYDMSHLATSHPCARSVRCFGCAVSWTSWLLFTGVPARCVVLRVRCTGPFGSRSLMCPVGVLC